MNTFDVMVRAFVRTCMCVCGVDVCTPNFASITLKWFVEIVVFIFVARVNHIIWHNKATALWYIWLNDYGNCLYEKSYCHISHPHIHTHIHIDLTSIRSCHVHKCNESSSDQLLLFTICFVFVFKWHMFSWNGKIYFRTECLWVISFGVSIFVNTV